MNVTDKDLLALQARVKKLEDLLTGASGGDGYDYDSNLMQIDRVTRLTRLYGTIAYGARAIRTTTQAISTATLTPLSWNTEIYDTDGCWSPDEPDRFYCRHEGYYMAGGSIEMAATEITAACRLFLDVNHNDTQVHGAGDNHTIVGKAGAVGVATGMFWMDVGDYVKIIFYHDIGTTKNIRAGSLVNQHMNNGWLMRIV